MESARDVCLLSSWLSTGLPHSMLLLLLDLGLRCTGSSEASGGGRLHEGRGLSWSSLLAKAASLGSGKLLHVRDGDKAEDEVIAGVAEGVARTVAAAGATPPTETAAAAQLLKG